VLTDEYINVLERRASKFISSNTNKREKIVEEAANTIKSIWTEDIEFDRDAVINVCDLSAKLGHSHIFLAYSPTSAW
jgi:hypothetical protein